jgi:peptide/nickel transport system ATP-binding protein
VGSEMCIRDRYFNRMPYQFSGGQLQRIAIARAMLLNPKLVVADEPTSSLDVSIRASILKLLKDFQERLQQAVIFITHDLALARLVSHRIAVMYLGKIVELGPADDVIQDPQHPYTEALVAAIPEPDPRNRLKFRDIKIKGEVPSPINVPPGCRFHPRCKYAMEICSSKEPGYVRIDDRKVKCWLYDKSKGG